MNLFRKTGRGREPEVLVALNYYYPYVSGLSEFAKQIAEAFATEGLSVEVVTTRHLRSLPREEVINGVTVRRYRVQLRIRNGVLSIGYLISLMKRGRRSQIVHLHLPMLEAGLVSRYLRGYSKVICTYHCDYVAEDSLLGRSIQKMIDLSSTETLRCSDAATVTSFEYRDASRISSSFSCPTYEIPPPFHSRDGGTPSFRQGDGIHFGSLGRIVEEKGLDVLINAFRSIEEPSAHLLIAGDYEDIAGGSVINHLRELAEGDHRIHFLGKIPEDELKNYFASLDVFILPSVNPLEAFGIVQLEAMSAGKPVIASDLPGVRIPVSRTKFGHLVPPSDVIGLKRSMLQTMSQLPWQEPEPYLGQFESASRFRVLMRDLLADES